MSCLKRARKKSLLWWVVKPTGDAAWFKRELEARVQGQRGLVAQ
jgi:hypothetical protein